MTTYHEWAEKKGRRPSTAYAARQGATTFDVVDIPGMLVTEGEQPDGSYMFTLPPDSRAQKALDRLAEIARAAPQAPYYRGYDLVQVPRPQGDWRPRDRESANDRHGWHCPCAACRTDRCEE